MCDVQRTAVVKGGVRRGGGGEGGLTRGVGEVVGKLMEKKHSIDNEARGEHLYVRTACGDVEYTSSFGKPKRFIRQKEAQEGSPMT